MLVWSVNIVPPAADTYQDTKGSAILEICNSSLLACTLFLMYLSGKQAQLSWEMLTALQWVFYTHMSVNVLQV